MSTMKGAYLGIIFFVSVVCTEENGSNTAQYTAEDFSNNISKQNHFVMFYAPWCGHCKRLAPTWEELSSKYNSPDIKQVAKIAKVDCTIDTALCSEQDVTGYPTLKFFKVGNDEGVKYRGARDLESLEAFIKEQLETKDEDPDTPEIPKPVNHLQELTEENFHSHVREGKHFVKFYAPWCGHCQRLAPTWDSLAEALAHDKSVTIGKVDCTLYKDICSEFEVKGYPTLLWIEDGKTVDKYQGTRTIEALKEFVNQMLIKDADSEGDPSSMISAVVQLNKGNFINGVAKGFTFVKFFAPWCGHCKRLAPTWDELAKKYLDEGDVSIAKVDCTESDNRKLCNEQKVDGFPTLILYRDGTRLGEYNGDRSLGSLYEFVKKHKPHDEL